MADARALTPADVTTAFTAVMAPGASGLVLAVSGGPDSMALMHLAAGLRDQGVVPPLHVATVDHGLRAGSAADAARVAEAAGQLGLPCARLVWTGPRPTRAIQEQARAARYRLLLGLCGRVGADHLVTAHTCDDQAETVLMRLLRGSGLTGLGGMRARTVRDGIQLVRPLLAFPKSWLIATCMAHGTAVVDDLSNSDPRFARTRLRRLLPLLAEEGCNAAALARLSARAAQADDALAFAAADAFAASRLPPHGVAVRLDAALLRRLPPALATRVLALAIGAVGGTADRLQRLEYLAQNVSAAVAKAGCLRATLGGALVHLQADGVLRLTPEPPRRRTAAQRLATPLRVSRH